MLFPGHSFHWTLALWPNGSSGDHLAATIPASPPEDGFSGKDEGYVLRARLCESAPFPSPLLSQLSCPASPWLCYLQSAGGKGSLTDSSPNFIPWELGSSQATLPHRNNYVTPWLPSNQDQETHCGALLLQPWLPRKTGPGKSLPLFLQETDYTIRL